MKFLHKTSKATNNLGTDDIKKLVPRLAIPAMLAQFINVLYSIIDRIYIGNIPDIGETALAGVGICGPIVTLLSAFAAWIGIGGAPLMSIRMGQKNTKEAEKILANSFLLLLGFSFVLTFLSYCIKDTLLWKFGANETIFPYADTYLSIYLAGIFFSILSLGLNQFIVSQGFAGLGMLSVVTGAVFNIILDPVFIFVFHMDVAGAAIATVISQFASCLFTLSVFRSKKLPITIHFKGYSLKVCLHILLVGFTPFAIILFDSILIIVQNVMIKKYGGADATLLLTCNTIVQSFMLLVTMPLGGITGGTQSILGYNYGAGNKERVLKAELQIVKTGLIYCCILFVIAQCFPRFFVLLFTRNALHVSKSMHFIRIYTLGIIPLACQYAFVDAFTGMGIAKASMPLSFFRKGLYIALAVILCMKNAEWIFWAEPISDFFPAILSGITFFRVLPRLFPAKNK